MSHTHQEFAVIGNPVEHSLSPLIHEAFGRELGMEIRYGRILASEDTFPESVRRHFAEGGLGLNVTVPFKEAAAALARGHLGTRALEAGAVNTLWCKQGVLHGCNTDGVGLLDDLARLGVSGADARILLIGAGGAARGIILPLLRTGCSRLHVVNRTPARALSLREELAEAHPDLASRLTAGGLDRIDGSWDLILNASASSLGHAPPDIPDGVYRGARLAYDLMYDARPTPFMRASMAHGAREAADGLGMLVGQAAESFAIWHGVRPATAPVLLALRKRLCGAS